MRYLAAECNACERIIETTVRDFDWARYVSGSFVQDVWPKMPIQDREVIIANRPGNVFGKLGFFCEPCTEEMIEAQEKATAEEELQEEGRWDKDPEDK